jgi:hypothetical protein
MPAKRPAGTTAKKSATRSRTTKKTETAPIVVESQAEILVDIPTDEIRRRAYSYWVDGNPDPVANWFRAENELKQLARQA